VTGLLPGEARIGVSGHQTLSLETEALVRRELETMLEGFQRPVVGVCSLAKGADQLFADCILRTGSRLRVVIPCDGYEGTFDSAFDVANFRRLLGAAAETEVLPFPRPSEQAFYAAGKEVVRDTDLLIAVWDGRPAAGLGGTADVVSYAKAHGSEVRLIWPEGASRS
jgi:hypothetical protein